MRFCLMFLLITLAVLTGCQNTGETPANENSVSVSGSGHTEGDPENTAAAADDAESEDSGESAENNEKGIQSIYTDLVENKCRDVDSNDEGEWTVQECDGVAGYKLLVSEGDLRQTIDIVSPGKEKYELNLWSVASGAFSTVGDKAEWRVVKENGKIRPVALIVRYNASENPDDAEKITSYLTVSKITTTGACVTHVIKPIPLANIKARELADSAADKPCKK